MKEKPQRLIDILCEAWTPRSREPSWQWVEKNVELDRTSSEPGFVSLDDFPGPRLVLDWTDNPECERVTLMVARQSGKTQTFIFRLLKAIREDPVTTIWTMANAEQVREFTKKRLFPALNNCRALDNIRPSDRRKRTQSLIEFATMNLLLRGSKADTGLRSDPAGFLVNDERGQWKKGAIHILRSTTTTFANSKELNGGTPEIKDDELHQEFDAGSQTFIHWNCPKCQRSQPFRFGRDPSTIYPDARQCGGLVWPESDVTKPGGVWNFDEVEKQTEYECENPDCRARFKWSDRAAILKSWHPFHRNPAALPQYFSVHWNQLYMKWKRCAWGKIAVQFLKAIEAMKRGDIEPLKRFVTEVLGEPWELRSKQKEGELLDRRGVYTRGQAQSGDDWALICTIDRQMTYLVYVIRQWRKNGASRLVWYGTLPSYDDLVKMLAERGVKNKNVWGDDGGHDTSNWRMTCLRHGWHAMKGEEFKHYTVGEGEKAFRQGWRKSKVDPGVGTSLAGRYSMDYWLFSKDWYREKLYNLFIPGLGPPWEIYQDIEPDYLTGVQSTELRENVDKRGKVTNYWHVYGPDHPADCEQMQLVVADICGITRTVKKEQHGKPNV